MDSWLLMHCADAVSHKVLLWELQKMLVLGKHEGFMQQEKKEKNGH